MQLYTPVAIEELQQDLPYLVQIMQWINGFVAKPNPNLGRIGTVCPFVPHSLKSNTLQLSVVRAKNLDLQEFANIILRYRDIFLQAEPREGLAAVRKAMVIVVPDIDIEDAPKIIDGTQKKLKPFFVESGLMIGEFHKLNQFQGLHNPEFRPFQSNIPMFNIRHMVESDIIFLQDENPYLRIKYLEAYLKHMQSGNSQIKNKSNLIKANNLLESAKNEISEYQYTNNYILPPIANLEGVAKCPFAHN